MGFVTALISNLFLLLFFTTPLIFTSFTSELFELPKMFFIYALTILIVSFHLVNYFSGKSVFIRRTPLDIPLLFFLLSQTISTVISIDPHTSFYGYYSRLNGGLLSLICFTLLYWVLAVYLDSRLKNGLYLALNFSGIIVAAYAVAQHFGIDKHIWLQDVQSRVFSTFGQPNWLAAFMCILIPFALYQYQTNISLILRSIYASSVPLFYLSLLFTKSKSGIIALLISLTVYFLLLFINKQIKIPTLGVILISFAILTFTVSNPLRDYILPVKTSVPPTTPVQSSSVAINITPSEDIRKIVWIGALDLFKRYPFFGTGVETFAYSYYWTRPMEHNLTSEWDFLYNKAHNEYLNYLATTGIVGLTTYLLFIFFTLLLLFKVKHFHLISAFLTILVSNIAGFSVVIISLIFFTLPLFALPQPANPNSHPRPKRFAILITLILTIIALKTITFHFLADVAFAQSESASGRSKYDLAYAYINSAISYFPQEPVYYNAKSNLVAKMALLAHGQKDLEAYEKYSQEAISSSNNAIRISPTNTNFWKERAQMYYYLATVDSKNFPLAIDALLKTAKLAPTDAKTYYLIGRFLETAGSNDDALKFYQEAANLKPNYDHAFFSIGQIYAAKKDYPNAAQAFQKVLDITPGNQDALKLLEDIEKLKR